LSTSHPRLKPYVPSAPKDFIHTEEAHRVSQTSKPGSRAWNKLFVLCL
jgi:hypothetical protein